MSDPRSLHIQLYSGFDPTQPVPLELAGVYYDWQPMLSGDNVKTRLANSIGLAAGVPQVRFLTGHRGVGKTTELYRVKATLERGDTGRKVFVSYLEAERWLDLADVDARDVVFQMARQLVADLAERGMGFALDRWKAFLGDIADRLDPKLSLGGDAVSLEVALKDSATARSELRRVLDPRLPTLYDLLNDILTKAKAWLAEAEHGGYHDVAVIVDQLDRIPLKFLDEKQAVSNHVQLFVHGAGALRALRCDVLYVLPIELAYSTWRNHLRLNYSAEIVTWPVVPVINRDGSSNEGGMAAMLEILDRRLSAAGASRGELLAEPSLAATLNRLSGGHMRQLFLLVRSALDRGVLPLTAAILNNAVRRQAIDIQLGLTSHHRGILDAVGRTKQMPEGDEDLFFTLLRDMFIFAYEDEAGTWYDRNPLLDALPAAPSP
jgi:hypothetical protein